MIRNFLSRISTVCGMEISSVTLQAIHNYSKLEPLPQFSDLSWLKVYFLESFWELLPTFLCCCPSLHTLVMEFEFDKEGCPMKLSSVPPCFVSSLKYVELATQGTTKTSSQMKLAIFFLRNCSVLKKLTLSGSFGDDIIKKIKKIPRRSRRFLESEENLALNRFKLSCAHEYVDDYFEEDSVLGSWIDALVRRRVRHLDFEGDSDYNELVWMPLSLYSCTTLVSLSLCHVDLCGSELASAVSLPCLKVMRLDRVRYDEDLEVLLASCPVLEKLTVIRGRFERLATLRVRSKSLKSLALGIEDFEVGFLGEEDHVVEIDAPRLELMSLRDELSRSVVIHSIAPYALVRIDVNFDGKYGIALLYQDDDDDDYDDSKRTMIRNFLSRISKVRGMEISSVTLQLVSLSGFGNCCQPFFVAARIYTRSSCVTAAKEYKLDPETKRSESKLTIAKKILGFYLPRCSIIASRDALLEFKDEFPIEEFDPIPWNKSSTDDCCFWKGVTCDDRSGQVTCSTALLKLIVAYLVSH
ncbi:F-box/FBD/LRR-repeat protein [Raphanus sativus]|nr:F-box/FBD/LRR-repeat protein [Raphanus sativus]